MKGWLSKYDDSIIAQGGETIPSSREERGLNQRLYNTIQPGIYPENFSQWAYNIRNVINNNNRFDSTRQVKKYDKLSDKLLKADESNDYDQVQNILNEMDHIKEFQSEDDPYSEDGWLKYLGLPQKNNTFTTSDQKPSRSENPNTTYYKLPNEFEKELLELYQKKLIKLPEDSIVNEKVFENVFGENKSRARVLHYFKFGEDQDDKGKYISYYDKYDLDPEIPIIGKINIPIGDPYEIYNRIYLDQTPRKEQGGTIPKAQEGTTLQRPYIAKQDATKVLLPLTKKVNQEENEYYNPPIEKGITSGDKRLDFLYNNQWLFDVPIVNDYIRKNAKELASISALGMVDDVEEFKELAKKNNLSYSGHGPGKGLISQYFDQDAFPPSKYKPTSDYLTFLPSYSLKANFESDFTKAQRDDYVSSFIKEGLTSKNDVIATEIPYNDFIKNKKPVYNRYPHANLVSLGNPDLGGHKMGAAWDYTVDLPYVSISDAWDFEPVHYTKAWAAYESEPERQKRRIQSTLLHKAGHPFKIYDRFYFDPKTKEYISDDSIQTLKREKGITPLEDEFLNKDISKYFTDEQSLKKFAEGGSMSYTPEYIEQLKQFENRPDNLAYHLDNKKIPTIGWGHRITEEELKRKAIKVGKEWVPYEKFSGKGGRQYADRLMELDVAHHYNRLEKQVGRDTLTTLPPEVQDVLLDITYNRGSLGDSLEYVKKGDIPGLKNYLADVSKGLKGGAKTRMEWRANRIPVKTLPPVEAPINYNVENQYVPEVLQSIAEQPSTQDIIPIQDNEGYRNQENYGKPVQITSNQSTTPISMQGVPFPILAMSDTGELKIMMPGEEHEFEGGSVTELPMAKKGGIIKSKQLRTFTEDNGWLNKYKEQ